MVSIPVLVDDRAGITLPESTAIVDYLDGLGEAPPLIPDDPVAALQARLWDRVIDGYLMTRCRRSSPTVCSPTDAATPRRRGGTGDAREGVRAAGQAPGGRGWAAGPEFTVADCAAAPALFYARIVQRWDEQRMDSLTRYFTALTARPSVARVIDEARAYRHLFPLPWPEYAQ